MDVDDAACDDHGRPVQLRVFTQGEPVVVVNLQYKGDAICQEAVLSDDVSGAVVQHLQMEVAKLEDGGRH